MTTLAEIRESQQAKVATYRHQVTQWLEKQADMPEFPDVRSSIVGRELFGSTSDAAGDYYQYFRYWVYACVNAIATRVAELPWRVGEVEEASPNPTAARTRRRVVEKMPSRISEKLVSSENVEAISHHEVLDLLARPNIFQRKWQFLYFTVANLEIAGVAYWIGGDDGETEGGVLYAVPATWMTINWERNEYKFTPPGNVEGIPIPAESVARIYFPHPEDPKKVFSPAASCLTAIKTDDYIQRSQLISFQHGIHPNLLITVGKVNNQRPTLTGAQRRHFIRSIREVWSQTVNQGDPAIIDGLIENVHKLHSTPQEMDWPQSAGVVKDRILEAYRVNPYILGQVTGVNKAQAVVAESTFNNNVINPVAGLLSEEMTNLVGSWYERPERLLIWLEEAKAIDREQRLREYLALRNNDDVTQEEIRSAILGLEPLEERDDKSDLLKLVGGITSITQMLQMVGLGFISDDQARAVLTTIMRLSEEEAATIVGTGRPPMAPTQLPALPQASAKSTKSADRRQKLAQAFEKRYEAAAEDLERVLVRYFDQTVDDVVATLKEFDWQPAPAKAEQQAAEILSYVFDQQASYGKLLEVSIEPLIKIFVSGVWDILNTHDDLRKSTSRLVKRTSAQDFAERYDIVVEPEGFEQLWANVLRDLPEDVAEAAFVALRKTFDEPYWRSVPLTTQQDLQLTLQNAIERGLSIPDLSKEIVAGELKDKRGELYNKYLARNIARTETGNMLNAGEASGIEQLSLESGLDIRKEWLSALGSTTRETHAATHGQISDTEGMFNLAGYRVPWPAHYSLPASERCNCQCSIISALPDEI